MPKPCKLQQKLNKRFAIQKKRAKKVSKAFCCPIDHPEFGEQDRASFLKEPKRSKI